MSRTMSKIKKCFRAVLVLALVTSAIITQTGCSGNSEPVSGEGYYLDTICQITIYTMEGMNQSAAESTIDGAFEVCEKYESMLSKTIEGSEIYKINHAGGEPVECSTETVELIKKALGYCELSGGRFDITIGQVTDLWDFHSEDPKLPDPDELAESVKHVDYHMVTIDGNKVSLSDPEGEIDLGAIAKGFIADKLGEYLRAQGVTGAVIDLGGNISVVGYKDGKETDVRVGIKKPFTQTGEIIGVVSAHDASLVTSGTYERCFEIDGKLYHHILDVDTGQPVDTDLDSVTIIGGRSDGADCDALATVCLILGKDEGYELIESIPEYEAVFVCTDGTVVTTSGVENFTLSEDS
jgi:thiamine biosynthesis lipoprotein